MQKSALEKIVTAITLILAILLILFMLDAFQYEPIAILSNSMSPAFNRGDVVIFKKLKDDELKELSNYSTIIYKIDEQYIAHRIVNKIEENGTTLFQTKGDNNNAPDFDLVQISQIKGVYAFHIKYIGFPTVWLHDYFYSY